MTFERIKIINGQEYRYLVKSVRVGGKVQQKYIKDLGKIDRAICWDQVRRRVSISMDWKLKLKFELIPSQLRGNNLHNPKNSKSLSPEDWNIIRWNTYKVAHFKCAICGFEPERIQTRYRKPKLYCHEIWSYNDETRVQKLEGFTALCKECHEITWFSNNEGDIFKRRKHFLKVNNFNENEKRVFHFYFNAAIKDCERRSNEKNPDWHTEYGEKYKLILAKAARKTEACKSSFQAAI